MNIEEVKNLLPVLQAYIEGKKIQYKRKNAKEEWQDLHSMCIEPMLEYRVKPEPKYRPFRNTQECWAEMQKHQPFGWVKKEKDGYRSQILKMSGDYAFNDGCLYRFDEIFNDGWTFADGTPFGIKEEE